MNTYNPRLWALLALMFSLNTLADNGEQSSSWTLSTSPNGNIAAEVRLTEGRLQYRISYKDRPVIMPSSLGFVFKEEPALMGPFTHVETSVREVDTAWTLPWGERKHIADHFTELRYKVRETADPEREMAVVFRVYDDGVGFRYEIPDQPGLAQFEIIDERTEFVFAENYHAWWIPAYRDQRYEYQYARSALSSLDVVHTPLTLQGDEITIVVHEAALVDYASMTLRMESDNSKTLVSDLVPWANGVRVVAQTPLKTPWRTLQIAEQPSDLFSSNLILNLNEPNKLGDVSWVEPGKYMGIWWEMHIGLKDWSPGDKQGATTERAKEYIDFAAEHGIDGVLVEGWNTGWEGEWWQRAPTFDFTRAVEGFDINEVVNYGKRKGVRLVGHHETAAGIQHYEAQMEEAFKFYERLGVKNVKTGYVGTRLDGNQWHHGQYMVRHFQNVAETAARHHITINAHEPIKDTGLRRTYPNMMTREGARGMEYNGGSPDTGNLPDHTTIVPFTRLQAGPFDYNAGIFNFDYREHRPYNRVPTTLAKQLALYVVIYSPLQMVQDLPENYEGHPAFQFVEDVATDWEHTRGINGVIGDYVTIARKDRQSDDWYLGAITDENARSLTVALDFLDVGTTYRAEIYEDGKKAHWRDNPEDYNIRKMTVRSTDRLDIELAPGGGTAIRFVAL